MVSLNDHWLTINELVPIGDGRERVDLTQIEKLTTRTPPSYGLGRMPQISETPSS
jgi:hypothetical protein